MAESKVVVVTGGNKGIPEDIAAMAESLISEKARFITGLNFVVDGGMTIKMIYE